MPQMALQAASKAVHATAGPRANRLTAWLAAGPAHVRSIFATCVPPLDQRRRLRLARPIARRRTCLLSATALGSMKTALGFAIDCLHPHSATMKHRSCSSRDAPL